MKAKHRGIGYIVLAVVILAIIFASHSYSWQKFSSPSYVREYLLSFGHWGKIIFVILLALSDPLPIPSTVVGVAGGYVFGLVQGTILAVIGITGGATISFFLARKFGRPLVEKMIHGHHIAHFEHIFRKRGINAVLISYAIPIFPSDAVDLLMGLTSIHYLAFVMLVVLGNIPRYLIINSLGDDLFTGFSVRSVLTISFAVLFVLVAVFREQIKRIVFTEIKDLEKEAEFIEEKVELVEEKVREDFGAKKKRSKKSK